MPLPNMSGVRDFDFLHGKWRVTHHTLKGRLVGATQWEVAEGIDIVRPAFRGWGNSGRFMRLIDGEPYEGMPIRLYNPRDARWRIYWLDTLDQRMEPPLVGGFKDGKGLFYGEDQLRGKAIKTRFTWSKITSNTARWDQSFSDDSGKNWELNSVMDFRRDNSLPDNPVFPLPA
ncbi:hypothetical protein [Parasphingorhabdus halotolerans]|uniref:DUF1579 domain-containing protein n=1 Tax=Parasphingorhabdus halotolerans TaxID=2725558 RepID=A0A6H2DQH1_9SPHN|nr:hypothetical protein [Parasphingorhabdus halotolerans]QJB69916.1 hypothetical protein HF685_11990 [Parasphingorhabdus halotolerans]